MAREDGERPQVELAKETIPISRGRGGRRRSAYATRDLTSGSIPKNLAFLAWPQVVEGLLNVFDQVWDLFLAGRGFGATAIAGIGVSQNFIQLARLGRMGLDTGMRAMISRAIGVGDIPLANHIALQSFTVNFVLAVVTVTFGVIFSEDLLRVVGVSDAVMVEAVGYLQWQFVATVVMNFRMSTGAALQAAGDTLTPMRATAVARFVDIPLAAVLMFGWLGLPSFGVAGIAVANVISISIAVAMNSHALLTGTSRLKLTFRGYRLDFPLIWRLVRIAAPASISSMERSVAQLILVALVAPFGDFALAAYSLTRRTQMIVNLGSQGLGNATGIIAGQNLGARRPDRAKETLLWALGYVSLVKLVLGALLFVFPALFLSIFSSEPEYLVVGVVWLQIQVFGYFFMGPAQVFQQAFNIAGDTVMPMLTNLVALLLVEVPLAIMLSGTAESFHPFGLTIPLPSIGDLGQFGIAWAITIAAGVRVLIYIPYFLSGLWLRKQVLAQESTESVPRGAP